MLPPLHNGSTERHFWFKMHFVDVEEPPDCCVMGIPSLWVDLQEMMFPGLRGKHLSFSSEAIDDFARPSSEMQSYPVCTAK